MKCFSNALLVCFFAVCLCAQPHWRTHVSSEPVSRKSKLFTLNSTKSHASQDYRLKYDHPPFITRPQCGEGMSECIHTKIRISNDPKSTRNSLKHAGVLDSNSNSSAATQVASHVTQFPAKLKNMYPAKPMFGNQQQISKSQSQPEAILIDKNFEKSVNASSNLLGSGTNNTEGRIIAYKLNQTSVVPLQALGSAAPRPTITLGQLAKQVLFPSWLWTRFSANRRIDTEGGNNTRTPYLKSAPATSAAPLSIPSITFDNNISRFMKLFTLVRFPNTPCVSASGRNGTCYHSQECASMGGTAANSCASGFGVCCVFQNTCGQTTSINGTYFVDNNMVFNSNSLNTCTLQVLKSSPAVKQMRLDFHTFSLQPPNAGSCELDRFIISGQNTNDIVPILCGDNNGTHLYVETESSSMGIQLSVLTTGLGRRSWSVRITQLEGSSHSSAPTNCLQYHTGVMGSISSFNYISASSPQYLNNLNYAICIRKEPGFCSVTFTNSAPDGAYMPFQVVNANDNGQLVIPGGQAGIGARDCPYDFLVINGIRLCGERFNDATTNVRLIEDAPVSDLSNGPFIVSIRTNELDVGGGFFLYYRQNPCMSTTG